jgi:hypothetical protein
MTNIDKFEAEKATKAAIKQQHPEAVFVTLPRVGLIALGAVSFDDYITYLSDSSSPSADRILVREQLVIDALIYPEAPDSKTKVRSVLRAMPMLLSSRLGGDDGDMLHELVEECSRRSEVKPLQLSAEEREKLEREHEFGIDGIWTAETGNIIVTTDESKSPFVRVVINEAQGARKDMGKKLVAAILASLVTPDRDSVEAVLHARPGLIAPLWSALANLTGSTEVEIAKN